MAVSMRLVAQVLDDQSDFAEPGREREEVWMITAESAILFMSASLLGILLFFPRKRDTFSAYSLLVTSRCAIRGKCEREPSCESGSNQDGSRAEQRLRQHSATIRSNQVGSTPLGASP